MSGANIVTINLHLSGFTFTTAIGSLFLGTLFIDGISNNIFFVVFPTSSEANGSIGINIPPGSHTFQVQFPASEITPNVGSPVGTFDIQFNDIPPTQVTNISLTRQGSVINGGPLTVVVACIHGSSLISTRNGFKRIDQIRTEDEVLSGDKLDQFVTIKAVAQCWITSPGPNHDAVIFEPGSLGEGQPSERLIIDPGHPMCTREEYLKNGVESLRPAGSFLNNKNIYVRKWIDPLVQTEPSVRFDLILPEPYCTYIANNVIVRSAGYKHHSHKDLI